MKRRSGIQTRRARVARPRGVAPRAIASPHGIGPALILVVLTAMLAGCFMSLETPSINLYVEPAYNDEEILISYSLWGSESSAQARWTLLRFEPGTMEWIPVDSREVRLPTGTSGVLELNYLGEAKYELIFELLTTRDGSYDVVTYLTQRREFFVDRTSPPTPAPTTINYYEGGTPIAGKPAFVDRVEAEIFRPFYDPDRETRTAILARIGEALPPLMEHARPERFVLWAPGGEAPPTTLYYVAIDEAGNRGELVIETFP